MAGVDEAINTQIEIFLACRNLPKLDFLSPSDPLCVLYMSSSGSSNVSEVGRTEKIENDPNPNFANSISLSYNFELIQPMRVSIYDIDSNSTRLADHDHIGDVDFVLGKLVAAPGQQLVLSLPNHRDAQVIVRCEEVIACNQWLMLQLAGTKLDKKDFFGKSDPYIEIERSREDGSWAVVHRTEVIKSTLNPTWKPFEISVQKLCNGDMARPIRFSCYDWNKRSAPALIGRATSSVKLILEATSYTLISDANTAKKGDNAKGSGDLKVVSARIETRHSFLDYIRGGCEISLNVAIDFTGSNGDPRSHSSLHFQGGPQHMNPYERALSAVGSVLEPYDSDNQYQVWGYGGRMGSAPVSHCFPLTLDDARPEVHGINGLLGVYRHALQHVTLSGPTLFHQVISTAAAIAARSDDNGKQHYDILLIITDGIINDMPQTKDAIVYASRCPLSIIIVGVGHADFSAMQELDSDNGALRASDGQVACRDIVQFLAMSSLESSSQESRINLAYNDLTREVLAELPGQLLLYMKQHNVSPLPARNATIPL